MMDLLSKIKAPSDVKKLTLEEKKKLCNEIRSVIIGTVASNGGHLASNLGVVELTVALFSVFDLEKDHVIWDVGHQAYTHKLLTGRYSDFAGLRTLGGISGFPSREESKYDTFTSGHSSASISAALGIAAADKLNENDSHTIAVIGDGSLTGGLAFEGLNNAGNLNRNFIVILNDNEMAISENVGSLAAYLGYIRTKPGYLNFKEGIERIVSHIPAIGNGAARKIREAKNHIKNNIYDSTMFDDLGFNYYGPFDGHNLELMIDTLTNLKEIDRPVLLHVRTIKGKGYKPAEDNPGIYHGVGKFKIRQGIQAANNSCFSDVFGNKLCELAERDDRICALTAAMASGTGLVPFSEKYPERFFDVGIAEGHATTFSGGLSVGGKIPFFAVYSTFLQRAYDNMLHDVSLQDLKCIFAIDRAGLVGEDGRTHHGVFDVSYLRTIPNVTVFSPCYYDELQMFMEKAVNDENLKLTAIRYPRGNESAKPDDYISNDSDYQIIGSNSKILLITYGRLFSEAYEAKDVLSQCGIDIDILKLNKIIPIEEECIRIASKYENVFFFEEGYINGGAGEGFLSKLLLDGYKGSAYLSAIKDGFVPHGSMKELLHKLELDSIGMSNRIKKEIQRGR